jgi:hypothetical protein
MPPLKHFKADRREIWSAVLVLVAVCSLTVSLATRYYLPGDSSSPTVKTIQTHQSPDAKRQRLTKNAANWMPPALSYTVLPVPSFYIKTATAPPPVRSLVCDESLYNRPPQVLKSLS